VSENVLKEMRAVQMVDLRSQYERDKAEFDDRLKEVIQSTAFINGKATKDFVAQLADYLDVKHVLPCANGTDALQIALMALDLQPGDEVITVPFTFVATVEVIALLRLKPVFVDIDPNTFNMDAGQIESKITKRTKAIIPVHLYGQAADMDAIMAISELHGIPVIEDTAQTIGADYNLKDGGTQKVGTIGAIGTTSFYPTKNLGAWGDGGAIMTNDSALAEKIRIVTNHGSTKKYYYDSVGVNSRLDSMQAAILSTKLVRLDDYNSRRNEAASFYDSALADISEITLPYRAPYGNHVFHQYTLKVGDNRDALRDALSAKKIPSMIYYPVPLHLSNAYKSYGYANGDFPVSEQLAHEVISLPMHTELDNEQLHYITRAIREFFS
jgi:UDP-2-acetamido-2-deoxy-ribo-hexuluronate aminotransferase